MKLYAIHHDDYPDLALGAANYIQPIQAGASLANSSIPPNFIRDDDDDENNLSSRNAIWGELTAHDWIRRHSQEDILGVCHYRRYFSPIDLAGLRAILGPEASSLNLLSPEVITEILSLDPDGCNFKSMLKTVDLILSYPLIRPYNSKKWSFQVNYWESVDWRKDWWAMRDAFRSVYPHESSEAAKFLAMGRCINPLLFIGKRHLIMAFWDWLFPLLFEIEERLPKKKTFRPLAILTEAGLFSWWLHSRPVSHVYVPLLIPHDSAKAGKTWNAPGLS